MSIGKLLREKREERKLSVADVSVETKINKKYIQALEDENYLLIPSQVYAKGFLKAYANFLGLEAKALVDELMDFYRGREEGKRSALAAPKISKMISMPKMPKIPPLPKIPDMSKVEFDKNTMYIALLAVFMLIFLVSVYGYVSYHKGTNISIKANPPATGKIEAAKMVAKTSATKTNDQSAAPKDKIEIRIEATEKTWVAVASGTKVLYNENLNPGMKLKFVGRELKVKAGNGAAVRISVNGEPMAVMGKEGALAEKIYRASE